jgi:multiple sugar transport system permease protein
MEMTTPLIEIPGRTQKGARGLFSKASLFFGYILLFLLCFVMLFPLVWMFLSSFKPGNELLSQPLSLNFSSITFGNYTTLLANVPLWEGFQNTLIVLLGQGALTMFFCPLAGFAFAKLHFRGRKLLYTIVLSTLMLPPIVLIIPLLLEMGALNWPDTYQALIFPGAIGAFGIFWMRQQIAEVPDELLDAGRIDGCSSFGLYWRIVLPVIRPALAALAILTFLNLYQDFVWPVIITGPNTQTLQVMLSSLYTQLNNAQPGLAASSAWGEVLAASTLATLPVLILFLVLQRQFVSGILSGSVKG